MARDYVSIVEAGELVTSTLEKRSATGEMADNVSTHIPLYWKLKNNSDPVGGGTSLVVELEYALNDTFGSYAIYDRLNMGPNQIIRPAQYTWKQYSVAISISGYELKVNMGAQRLFNLFNKRIKNSQKSFYEGMAKEVYQPGTANQGKTIGGLQHLVSDNGAGTVGGINSTDHAWWKNSVYDFSTNSMTLTPANISRALTEFYQDLIRNTDKPDCCVTTRKVYTNFERPLQTNQRFTADPNMAKLGFEHIMFHSMPVFWDQNCPDNRLYMLNSEYLQIQPHSAGDMVPLGGDRTPLDQDAMIRFIGWMGNMTVSNRRLQGVMKVA